MCCTFVSEDDHVNLALSGYHQQTNYYTQHVDHNQQEIPGSFNRYSLVVGIKIVKMEHGCKGNIGVYIYAM